MGNVTQDFDLSILILTDDALMSHSCNLNKTYCNNLDNKSVSIVLINWIHDNSALQEKKNTSMWITVKRISKASSVHCPKHTLTGPRQSLLVSASVCLEQLCLCYQHACRSRSCCWVSPVCVLSCRSADSPVWALLACYPGQSEGGCGCRSPGRCSGECWPRLLTLKPRPPALRPLGLSLGLCHTWCERKHSLFSVLFTWFTRLNKNVNTEQTPNIAMIPLWL